MEYTKLPIILFLYRNF